MPTGAVSYSADMRLFPCCNSAADDLKFEGNIAGLCLMCDQEYPCLLFFAKTEQ